MLVLGKGNLCVCVSTKASSGRGENVPCVSQSAVVKSPEPELAALAQALCWTAQLLWRAPPTLTKVSPLMVKGLVLPAELVTGGAAPPRVPVKVWTLVPLAFWRLLVLLEAVPTAALISSAVASSWRRFWLMMQPTESFSSSQLLPLPVLSVFCVKKSQSHPCSDEDSFTYVAGGKSTGLDGQGRVGADGGELLRHVQGDLLVARGGVRGRILVLGDGGDLGVGGGLVADDRGHADAGRVSLQGAEHDGVGHARDIVGGLGVGEGLVGDDLLEAVEVVDVGGALGGGGVAEEREDGILDLQRVVELQVRVCDVEDGLVRVLLGDLSLGDAGVEGEVAGSSQAGKGEEDS